MAPPPSLPTAPTRRNGSRSRCRGTTAPEQGTARVQYSSNTSGCTAPSGSLLSGYIYWHQGTPTASDLTITLTNKNNNLQDPPPLNYTDVNSVGATGAVSVQFTSPTASATKE